MKLNAQNLAEVGKRIAAPTYDRRQIRPGIVHFGVGGFHRAHEAMYLDALFARGLNLEFGIVGVGLMPGDERMRDVLESQDGLYTLLEKPETGELRPRVIGSIIRYVFAPDDPLAVLAAMTDPDVRIVSLTITEGGYSFDQVTGEFDPSSPDVLGDLEHGHSAIPQSAFGFLTAALRERRMKGIAPFTVMSCDNIAHNGNLARRMLCAFARLQDGATEFADWIDATVAFPNSMVDRITPVTAEEDRSRLRDEYDIEDEWPVGCEPFVQWVLEDEFPTGRPAFERVGVQVVGDVAPYELMKLRLLNASHQALCYLGYLSGYRYVHDVCTDPTFSTFIRGFMDEEVTPTLPSVPGVDLDDYKSSLLQRFANPEISDTLARLCAETSDRIPKFLIPVVRDQIARNGEIGRSALVIAAWARYAEGVDEVGRPIDVVDPRRDELMELAGRQSEEPTSFLRAQGIFGSLATEPRFVEAYLAALHSLRGQGAHATVAVWSKAHRAGST